MKTKIISLSLITCVNLFAIDINQAIDTAIENNYSLKQQQYILDESGLNLDSSYSGYKPKLDLNYTFNNRNKLVSGQIKKDSSVTATISYNLFNGFMDKYNIDAKENLFASSKLTYEASKQDLILEVKSKYINYLLSQKTTQTANEAVKLYEKQYNDSSNFFDQGLIAKNELLEVEVQMLQATQNLQNAKADEKISKYELENKLGSKILDEVESIELDESISFEKSNIENRSELKALELVSNSYTNIAKANQSGYMPSVDASFSVNKYGESVSPTNRTDYPSSQNVGTIELNWNLYNGNSDNTAVMINRKKAKQYKMQLEDLKQEINLQYQNANEQLEVSKLNLKTATKALETSKLNYEIVLDKVQEGLSSNKDLIDANYLLTQSKQNYFSAYYNRYLAIATLQRVLEKSN
ncbi:TolC family protein [Arcobacteraceae bacterium]|nr:TolC family protein [Arcobacteraceae bacterium]